MAVQPAQKAARRKKDWYTIPVDTLRGWGLLLLILALVGLGVFGYRVWDRRALENDAKAVIGEAAGMLGRVQNEQRAASFAAELTTARQSLQEAESRFAAREFQPALDHAERSRNVLLSIIDTLELRSSAGQAQFIKLQGEVEYRRRDGGDWQEARGREQLQTGDSVRTSEGGSAEIMFRDGTLYLVRPNTQFIVSSSNSPGGGAAEQSIQMDYGWVNLSTSHSSPSSVRTPGVTARVEVDSEAFVSVDKDSSEGRFGAYRGGMQLSSRGGLTREVKELQQVVQTGDLLSEPKPLPGRPEPQSPQDNHAVDLERTKRLVLSWAPVPGATRYSLQVSRNQLFVDNVIDDEDRTKTKATLGLRGEGSFSWRVAAVDAESLQGPWSETRRFRVSSSRTSSGEKKDATPPELDLDDVKTYGSIFMVAGRSEPGARIEVNGELVKTNADGTFTKTVQVTKEGWNTIEISARDAWGNKNVRWHRVFVENP